MNKSNFRNTYPIVLVHGFCGWDRDEVFGFKYWGGPFDIEARLNELHVHTYSAAVGPVSSSWERAVELYYYLVGGTVDYGAAHAKKYGIQRFGRTLKGIYPQISDTNRIHLVGHSMGAQTSADFESFLRNGSKQERDHFEKHPEEGISDLFLGGKNWVHSITGVAPAFNGSTLGDSQNKIFQVVENVLLKLAAAAGSNFTDFVYDFKLDQWGLQRREGEYFIEYFNRVRESEIWTSGDTAFTDLSTTGAAKIAKERLRIFPETYYFSFHGNTTFENPKTGYWLPMAQTNPILYLDAARTGRLSNDPVIPEDQQASWRPSDGLVNCIAGKNVLGQPVRDVTTADTRFEPGIWNAFPVMNGWDHIDFMGLNKEFLSRKQDILPLYTEIARIVTSTERRDT
ncbi:esterase/lipase family protein [Paraburkholderia dipogonis]|uniref:esterase/lipase family protein n=1 Tax=Paraburkholderia dipogonis TaxID=1211383 RepID=UPI0038BA2850